MTQPLPDRLARPFDLKTTILPTAVYLSLKEIFSIPKHGVLPIRLIDAFLLTKFPNATFFMSGNPLRVRGLPTEGDPPAAPVSPPTEVAPEGDPPPELCAELGGKAWLPLSGRDSVCTF